MKIDCSGQRAMVTAGASGLGKVIARALAEAGMKVHVCDVSEDALASFRIENPQIHATLADVSRPEGVDRFFDKALGQMGSLDVLVNNAGIASPTARLEDISIKDWDQTVSVDLNAQFYFAMATFIRSLRHPLATL